MNRFDEPPFIIVMTVITLTFMLDLIAYFCQTPLEHDMKVMLLTTFNTGGFMTALNYAIGSSGSSKVKDDTINALSKGP